MQSPKIANNLAAPPVPIGLATQVHYGNGFGRVDYMLSGDLWWPELMVGPVSTHQTSRKMAV